MHAPKFRAMLVLVVCAALSQPVMAQITSDSDQLTEFILAKIQEKLTAVANYRCTQIIPRDEALVTEERRSLFIDRQGRGRVEIYEGANTLICICDGSQMIGVLHAAQPDGSVVYSASISVGTPQSLRTYDAPLFYMGGMLADELSKTRSEGGKVHTSSMIEGRYRIDQRNRGGIHVITIIDPNRSYAPVQRRTFLNSSLRKVETITFEEIEPGIWFPREVYERVDSPADARGLGDSKLKCKFIGVTVNTGGLERALVTQLAQGTKVSDKVRGQYYVVGTDTIRPLADRSDDTAKVPQYDTLSGTGPEPWRKTFDNVYHLEENEVLKYIEPPFIPERTNYLASIDPDLARQNDRTIQSRVYLFRWDEASSEMRCLSENRSVELGTILEHVVQLGSYAYEGPTYLLKRRLTGDWIVRDSSTIEQRLRALEPILAEQTKRPIRFVRRQTRDLVVRASGTYQFRPLPQAPDRDNVFVVAGNWDLRQTNTLGNVQCGTTAALLDCVANAIGAPILYTGSSEEELCWSIHESANLRDIKRARNRYNANLGALLNNLISQTNLAFRPEIDTFDVWHITTQQALAAQAK